MKVKKEYLVLIAVAAGLAGYIALHESDRTLYKLPEIPPVAGETLTRLQVTRNGATLTLVKQDGQWLLEPSGYPADPERIKPMLDAVSGLKATALVSEAEDYLRYELDDARRLTVTAWAGDTRVRDFDIGKTAPSFRHTFVKLAGDRRVFHARGNFRNAFDQTGEALQNKTVMTVKPSEAATLRILADGGEVAFSRSTAAAPSTPNVSGETGRPTAGGTPPENPTIAQWLRDDGQAADPAAVEKLLAALATVKCRQYIDGMTITDLTDPIYRLDINDGAAHTLSIFPKQEKEADQYPAVSSDSRFPFFLGADQAERIMQRPEALMPEMPDDVQGEKQAGQS